MSRPKRIPSPSHPVLEPPADMPPVAAPDLPEEPDEPSDLDRYDLPCTDEDDRWDVFIPDDDERDPWPDRGDFWHSGEEAWGSGLN